jgi:hypothetical protein
MGKGTTYNFVVGTKNIGHSKFYHEILAKGSDLHSCKNKTLQFFQNYQLVRYSRIFIRESLQSSQPNFWENVEKAVLTNYHLLHELIKDLEGEGFMTIRDLGTMPQGYKSSMLHTITHFVDGFFGIDTYFYNLEEDSHWVSEKLKEEIKNNSDYYWLLSIEAQI